MKTSSKKSLLILLTAAVLCLLSACGGDSGKDSAAAPENKPAAESQPGETAEIPVILNQTEYVLYQQIFYNKTGDQYTGQKTNKEGVFTMIADAYKNRTRYYVWGYLDNTMCCDWQWEFVPSSTDNLPPVGSRVKVSGTFQASEDALDGYWIEDASVETVSRYTGETAEINMRTMSDTLERVQLVNMFTFADQFNGKEYIAYGRVASGNKLEDPYYDGSWYVPYESDETMPAIGTIVVIRGIYQDETLAGAKIIGRME